MSSAVEMSHPVVCLGHCSWHRKEGGVGTVQAGYIKWQLVARRGRAGRHRCAEQYLAGLLGPKPCPSPSGPLVLFMVRLAGAGLLRHQWQSTQLLSATPPPAVALVTVSSGGEYLSPVYRPHTQQPGQAR